jgi:hypothetical protein
MMLMDVWITIIVISLLFLRHTAVYKDPTKINYTPVVLALGFIGALLHFILSPQIDINVIKESLLSLSVGVLLSAIMSVMNQTVSVFNTHNDRVRLHDMGEEIAALSATLKTLREELDKVLQLEHSTHEEIRQIFKEEVDALSSIQSNQKLFVTKIESLMQQQQSAMRQFEEFTLSELPSLDNVVHRHIDLLRIAEQDHFNHLKNMIQLGSNEQKEMLEHLVAIEPLIAKLNHHQLPDHTIAVVQKELNRIIGDFSHHLQALGSKTESIVTSLVDNETLIRGTREQSELIMQQMVLSSKQMKEITTHSKEISDTLLPLSHLFASAESLHAEFLRAKSKLSELIITLQSLDHQEYRAIRQALENVASEATAQMELFVHNLLEKEAHLKESRSLIDTKNVQELASKVKLTKSYLGENQE